MADVSGGLTGQLLPHVSSAPTAGVELARRRTRWELRYRRRLLASDLLVLTAAVLLAHAVTLGFNPVVLGVWGVAVPYIVLEVFIVGLWLCMLAVLRTRDSRVVMIGTDEYQRVFRAAGSTLAILCVLIVALDANPSRIYLGVVFVASTLGVLHARWMTRRWLSRQRAAGKFRSHLLLVGSVAAAQAMAERLEEDSGGGFRVSGIWSPGANQATGTAEAAGHEVPVLGVEYLLHDALRLAHADTVVVTDTEVLGYQGLNELGWALDGTKVRLLVAPHVLDVTGPRIRVGAVANVPVLHLGEPQYAGANGLGKAVFDRVFATVALTAALPILLVSALAIKLTSRGSVFYRQVRIGRDGEPFWVLKLRTMRRNADDELPGLIAAHQMSADELFKLTEDPRVTRVGRVLRRWSIDEIPQFVNVLRGDMSVVGPRPHVPTEVAMFNGRAGNRLRVRPGITGLWQVSGRSNLDSAQAVRLDLQYVENWTMFRDLQICWRTVLAVLRRDGAS